MKWTRNDREILYLAGIFLLSLVLSPPGAYWIIAIIYILFPSYVYAIVPPIIMFPVLILFLGPHLLACVYAMYMQASQTSGGLGRQEGNYLLALLISALLSTVIAKRLDYLTLTWYIEVAIVVAVLLIPTFHAYFEYKKNEDIRDVVLLILIYAPWVQFFKLFLGYM